MSEKSKKNDVDKPGSTFTLYKSYRDALDLINADPHVWSKGQCTTCNTISSLISEPFGCTAENLANN